MKDETMRQNTSYIAWTVERLRTLCKARKVLSASTRFFILNSSFFILLSCSIMDDGPDALSLPGGSTAQVAFTLKLDKAQPATRTTWGDDYDSQPGTGYENRIDQLQVVLYSTDSNNAAYPLHNLWQETSSTQEGGQDTYTFVGSIDTNDAGSPRPGKYKIMVFANCTDLTNNETNLGNLAYTYTYNNSPAIPMWGVTTATLTLRPGERQTLTEGIDLLRAVAKVEVQLQDNDDTQGFSLTGVTISKANQQGYCLPLDYDKVATTAALNREEETGITTFHPYPNSATTTDLAFTNDGNNTYTLYLPEYDNGTGNTPATLSVTVADEDNQTETYTLEFKNYTNGQPTGEAYNIVRNHLYRYTITKIDNGQLTVQHQVMPWEKVTSGITYGDIQCELLPEGGDSGDAAKGDPEAIFGILHKPTYASSHDFSVLKPGTAGATYEFTLTAPEGAVWTAHLSNNKDFYFSDSNIDTDNDGTKETKMVSTGIARTEKYYIQINATNPWQEIEDKNGETLPNAEIDFDSRSAWGAQVEAEHRVVETYFYITILADGDMQEKELEINPTLQTTTHFVDNRRFPGTATRIWIRQVPAQKGRSGEDQPGAVWNAANLAADVNPTDEDFQWWRVNPYWAH